MSSLSLTPSNEDLALLTAQYHKALAGMYEAYAFGAMLLTLKIRLERAENTPPMIENDPLPVIENGLRENQSLISNRPALARVQTRGKVFDEMHGWNAGLGLKGWLAEHCPEINYWTARRFLALAEATQRALAPMPGDVEDASEPWEPTEETVRAYLAGKSQRQVLRLGGKRPGAGAPKKAWSEALGTSPAVAWKKIEEALLPLNTLLVEEKLANLLDKDARATLRNALSLLLAKLDE